MDNSILIEEHVDRVILTLNRSDKANALTAAMLHDLAITVQSYYHVPVLILTGAGRVFSAGADLDDVENGTLATDPIWEVLSNAISDFPGLTIAALNGTVAGGAMGMVLACDVRISVPAAKFFYPVIAKGVDPQPNDTSRLTRLIGPARATQVMILGQKIDANTAHHWGLLTAVADAADMSAMLDQIVAPVAAAKPGALGRIKAQIYNAG